jgi:hypothetical protein
MADSTASTNPLDWITSIISTTAGAYSTIKTADALKDQVAVGADGTVYTHGQLPLASLTPGISPTWLLIGGGLLLFMFLRKD